MKKNFIIFNCIMVCLFSIFVLLNFFTSNGEYSYLENRYLEKPPVFSVNSLINREFMNDAENYCNDHLIFRDFFVTAKAYFEKFTGKRENNGVYFAKDGFLIEKPSSENKTLTENNILSITDTLNVKRFKTTAIVIPQAFESLKDKLPRGVYNSSVADVYTLLKEKIPAESYVNPSEKLSGNSDAYYRTDHHLTAEGTYEIYTLLADKLGYTPIKKEDFKKEVVSDDFLGTTYSKALTATVPDKITAYITKISESATVEFIGENKKSDSIFFSEHLTKKDKYSYFLDGNHGLSVVRGNASTGKSLAIFKDSYAHALAPLLINHYDSLHLIDMRYYREDPVKYIVTNDIKDILFIYGSSTFSSDDTIAKISDYMKTSPYSKIGKLPESAPVSDSWFSDALFIGDSLTMGYEAFSGMTEGEYLCRTGLSVGGVFNIEEDGTSIIDKSKQINPKKIYVLLGTNEYLVPNNLENVVNKFRNLITTLKKNHPESYIFIQSIFPYSAKKEASGRIKNSTIASYNEELIKLAEELACFYVAPSEAVTDENGYLRPELTHDGIHLNNKGCRLWAEYLRCHTTGEESAVPAMATVKEDFEGKYPLSEIAKKIKDNAVFEITPEETTMKVLIKTHNLEEEKTIFAYGMVGAGTSAEEISLFEMKTEKDAKEAEKILSEYVKSRIKSFDSYLPSETPKLKSAVILRKDTLVALIVAKDVKNADEIIKGYN